jgi:hypothetical protein
MSGVENLDQETEALFRTSAKELTSEQSQLRFGMLPIWARQKYEEDPAAANMLLTKLYELWKKLDVDGRVARGNKGYTEWTEARISVIKATARLDGKTSYMARSAIHDGSLPQRWRSVWAYLNFH